MGFCDFSGCSSSVFGSKHRSSMDSWAPPGCRWLQFWTLVQEGSSQVQVSAVDCWLTVAIQGRRHCLLQTDQTNNKFGQQTPQNDNFNFDHIHHDRRADMEAAVSGIHSITDRFIDRTQIGHKLAQPDDARALVYPAKE